VAILLRPIKNKQQIYKSQGGVLSMQMIQTLRELHGSFQAAFDKNEKSLDEFRKTDSKQLKAYLLESNLPLKDVGCPDGEWRRLEDTQWYVSKGGEHQNLLSLDASRERVWILYSLIDADKSKVIIDSWIKNKRGNLDKCWLSRPQLLHWENLGSKWTERGLGIRFSDGLTPEDSASNVSLKAWYGASPRSSSIKGIHDLLVEAKKNFAISSVRWQKRTDDGSSVTTEWYSNGKVTVNRAVDVDEVLNWISEMGNRYEDSLVEATKLRDSKMAPFEIDFTQQIDLDAFSKTVTNGQGDMKLWLMEIEHHEDFRRYKGVDLHTWDRILLDVGLDYAYLTIPGKGCVNAAPRLAVLQGEDNAGVTSIYHDGSEVFT
jgi:hypothetical protein